MSNTCSRRGPARPGRPTMYEPTLKRETVLNDVPLTLLVGVPVMVTLSPVPVR